MRTAIRIILLTTIFLSTFPPPMKAQLLNNTRWKIYDNTSQTFDRFWNFQNDTIAQSFNNITWDWFATYTEVGNVFTIHDIIDFNCNDNYTGVYNFSIHLDTLRFTEIVDQCNDRSDYFAGHFFLDFPIGINELEEYKNVKVFPSPFRSELNIKTTGGAFDFSLYDISGRKVVMKTFDELITIETGFLEPGMYLYELKIDERVVRSGTVIKI